MAESWIEPRTRIPFVGIIAMVLIVAVVAVFIKTQLAPLFPESTITVQDETSMTGRASDSFYGVREVDLQRKELLVGSLNRQRGGMSFTVDAPGTLLTITKDGRQEQIELTPNEGVLSSRFEYDSSQMLAVIDAPARTLTIGTEASMPLVVSLSDEVTYIGTFTFKCKEYSVSFVPGGELLIDGKGVQVSQDGKTYTGTWTQGKTSRPVSIDMEKQVLSIQDLY